MAKLYSKLANTLIAFQNCIASGNHKWQDIHENNLEKWVKEYMPSGAGISEPELDLVNSLPDRLEFKFSYHQMDDNGSYCGYLDMIAIVKPSLAFGYDLQCYSRGYAEEAIDLDGTAEYLHQTFSEALEQELDETGMIIKAK